MEPVALDRDQNSSEEQLLLRESSNVDQSWRLNFDGFQLSEHKEKPPRGFHDCLGVLASEDSVAEFYQQQGEMLEGFNEMDALAERGFVPGMSKEEKEKLARSETTAIRLSNVANMFLFAAKVYASVRSGSLAIIASTLDSLLDLLSGFILWFTAFSMQTPNPYQYPIGKKRMQPLDLVTRRTIGRLDQLNKLTHHSIQLPITKDDLWPWHWRLGHLSFHLLRFLSVFTNNNVSEFLCESCQLGKQHRASFAPSFNRSLALFSLIHYDVWGPSHVVSLKGRRWFVTFIDDFSRTTWVYLMKEKS